MNLRFPTYLLRASFPLLLTCVAASAQQFDLEQGPFGVAGGSEFGAVVPSRAHFASILVDEGPNEILGIAWATTDLTRSSLALTQYNGQYLSVRGTRQVFPIAAGDRLVSIGLWVGSAGIVSLEFTSLRGINATFGMPQSSAPTIVLGQQDYEIAGIFGTADSARLLSLGATLRPLWESTEDPVVAVSSIAVRRSVVPLGDHIGAVEI